MSSLDYAELYKRVKFLVDLGALVVLSSVLHTYGAFYRKDAVVELSYVIPSKLYGTLIDKVYKVKKISKRRTDSRTDALCRCNEEIIKHVLNVRGSSLIKLTDMMLDETITKFDNGPLAIDNEKVLVTYQLGDDSFSHEFDNNCMWFDELLQIIEGELTDRNKIV